MAGDFDHRTKIASKRTTSRWIDPDHWNEISLEVSLGRRYQDRRIKLTLPALVGAIDRCQLASSGIPKYLKPDHLGFGESKADAAAVKHIGVACHRMRSADDAVSNTV